MLFQSEIYLGTLIATIAQRTCEKDLWEQQDAQSQE